MYLIIFNTSVFIKVTIGPTAVNSIMSYNYAGPDPLRASTLAFLVGLAEMTAGLFHLGEIFFIAFN